MSDLAHPLLLTRTVVEQEGILLSDRDIFLLAHYLELLGEWNQRINLISRKEDDLERHHLLHSLLVLPWMRFSPRTRILDIGTGGGLPGLPLAILHPDTEFILCDSIEKKTRAVEDMVRTLNLPNVTVLRSRVEDLSAHLGSSLDGACARAVTKLDQLARWTQPLLRAESGFLLAWKGGDTEEECERTRRLTGVRGLEQWPSRFSLEPYFLQEHKYIIRVDFRATSAISSFSPPLPSH